MPVTRSTGGLPGAAAAGVSRSGAEASVNFADCAQKIKQGLPGVNGASSIDGQKGIGPGELDAADDAWVSFLATAEQLQKPGLSSEKAASMLRELDDSWRAFKSKSELIERHMEAYIASQTGKDVAGS